jgi:hypothetical protein
MAKDKINEATTVASSRSRGGNKKDNKTKQQQGTAREEKIISIITDEDTNAFSGFAKFLEQHFNEYLKKEIKKKLN